MLILVLILIFGPVFYFFLYLSFPPVFPIILCTVVSVQCFFSEIEYQLFPLRPLSDGDFMSLEECVVFDKAKILKQKLLHVTEICLLV